MTSKFLEIVPLSHRQGNGIAFTTIRWPDFSARPPFGRPFSPLSRHSDTSLLSLSPRHRFPQPTPERAAYAGAGFRRRSAISRTIISNQSIGTATSAGSKVT